MSSDKKWSDVRVRMLEMMDFVNGLPSGAHRIPGQKAYDALLQAVSELHTTSHELDKRTVDDVEQKSVMGEIAYTPGVRPPYDRNAYATPRFSEADRIRQQGLQVEKSGTIRTWASAYKVDDDELCIVKVKHLHQLERELAQQTNEAKRWRQACQDSDERTPSTTPRSDEVDEIVSGLYKRFKEWSKRGFGPEDVTWCEVKADVLALLKIPAPSTTDHKRVPAPQEGGTSPGSLPDRIDQPAVAGATLTGETPRTDAAIDGWADDIVRQSRLIPADAYAKVRDLARQLERELAATCDMVDDLAQQRDELLEASRSAIEAKPDDEIVIACLNCGATAPFTEAKCRKCPRTSQLEQRAEKAERELAEAQGLLGAANNALSHQASLLSAKDHELTWDHALIQTACHNVGINFVTLRDEVRRLLPRSDGTGAKGG